MRRTRDEDSIPIGKYILDKKARDLTLNGKYLHIGTKNYMLLELLLENNNRIVTIDEIKQRLWENYESSSYGAIRVYITRLKKLFPNAIENVRGVGYKFSKDKVQD